MYRFMWERWSSLVCEHAINNNTSLGKTVWNHGRYLTLASDHCHQIHGSVYYILALGRTVVSINPLDVCTRLRGRGDQALCVNLWLLQIWLWYKKANNTIICNTPLEKNSLKSRSCQTDVLWLLTLDPYDVTYHCAAAGGIVCMTRVGSISPKTVSVLKQAQKFFLLM